MAVLKPFSECLSVQLDASTNEVHRCWKGNPVGIQPNLNKDPFHCFISRWLYHIHCFKPQLYLGTLRMWLPFSTNANSWSRDYTDVHCLFKGSYLHQIQFHKTNFSADKVMDVLIENLHSAGQPALRNHKHKAPDLILLQGGRMSTLLGGGHSKEWLSCLNSDGLTLWNSLRISQTAISSLGPVCALVKAKWNCIFTFFLNHNCASLELLKSWVTIQCHQKIPYGLYTYNLIS